MSYLTSEPRMSDREKVCAEAWLRAAIDDEDPETAAYWQYQGLVARTARICPGTPPPPPPPRPAACDLCGSASCKNSDCLL